MRTTLELPDDLLRKAKIVAVERRTTLRELVGKALARELGMKEPARARRAMLPISNTSASQTRNLTSKDLADSEVESRVMEGKQVWVLRPKNASDRPWLACLLEKTQVTVHAMDRVRESIAAGRGRKRK